MDKGVISPQPIPLRVSRTNARVKPAWWCEKESSELEDQEWYKT